MHPTPDDELERHLRPSGKTVEDVINELLAEGAEVVRATELLREERERPQ